MRGTVISGGGGWNYERDVLCVDKPYIVFCSADAQRETRNTTKRQRRAQISIQCTAVAMVAESSGKDVFGGWRVRGPHLNPMGDVQRNRTGRVDVDATTEERGGGKVRDRGKRGLGCIYTFVGWQCTFPGSVDALQRHPVIYAPVSPYVTRVGIV